MAQRILFAAPRRAWLWLLVGLLCLVAPSVAGASAPAPTLMPDPGTPDASPTSQIVLGGVARADLRSIDVIGARSGRHLGRLEWLPREGGVAFIPAHRFAPGEQVSVTARLRSAAGQARHPLSWRFSIAVVPSAAAARTDRLAKAAAQTKVAVQHFVSRPDLQPPAVHMSADQDPGAGDIFLDVQHGPQQGPLILDPQGKVVWFSPLSGSSEAFDVREQTYEGKPTLTFWVGRQFSGHGIGTDLIYDTSYRQIGDVKGAEGFHPDLHEFLITPRNTAFITAYQPVRADMRSVHGSRRGSVLDNVVQEIDIRTGKLLWEWHALGHIPLTASYAGLPPSSIPFDFFHINSVQQIPDGDVLISARNTWAIYLVSRHTGRILWQLGGRGSTFKVPTWASFTWQHDARLTASDELTVFNDHSAEGISAPKGYRSKAMALKLDYKHRRAALVRSYYHSPQVLAGSQGNMQTLPDGNVLVGWGSQPYFSEYSASGSQLLSGSLPRTVASYRAFRFPWHASPTTSPNLTIHNASGGVVASASWNGATEVASWQLLGGTSATNLTPLSTQPRNGFETQLSANTGDSYFEVRALSASGTTLGTSSAVVR